MKQNIERVFIAGCGAVVIAYLLRGVIPNLEVQLAPVVYILALQQYWRRKDLKEKRRRALLGLATEIGAQRDRDATSNSQKLADEPLTETSPRMPVPTAPGTIDAQHSEEGRGTLSWYFKRAAEQDADLARRVRVDQAAALIKAYRGEQLTPDDLELLYGDTCRKLAQRPAIDDALLGSVAYPVLVVRVFTAIYQRERIQLRGGPPHFQLVPRRCILQHPWPVEPDGRVTDDCREFLLQGVQAAVRSRSMKMCVVWDREACTYVEADRLIESRQAPSGGEPGFALSSLT